MKYLVLPALLCLSLGSCKKDSYGYTCSCKDKTSGHADTSLIIRVQTSGEADYRCKNFADTANKYGKNIQCTLD